MSHECPCQSGALFAECCKPLLTNKKHAATAEALMRSRYTAYTRSDWKYVFKTWHKSTRPTMKELRSGGAIEWLGLKIIHCEEGLIGDDRGIVAFVATYQDENGLGQLKETSQFVFENGQWFYLNATELAHK